ncbi:helix-turn-helix transcriptional regulator [Bifidobacterium bombi]|uniref:Uncharacterized protein n=1 Tax=Bifidobacterium bombi DSM 19703 TaxID=1341695 RepID=A0A080N4S0_9BIFI|nr:hypothetical protein [Bifidobacterium bombi]KFF31660.1 hypothetical protein BBOMB_1047 [Bifidobacterium bombi DSM 19703]
MTAHYLSITQIADMLGIAKGALAGYRLPEPDATIGRTRGWSEDTIEKWVASRPGHGGRPKKH